LLVPIAQLANEECEPGRQHEAVPVDGQAVASPSSITSSLVSCVMRLT
jgi:hypothetical protein